MKRTLSIILMLVLLVCQSSWAADVKVSALPATTTLTDDDLFMTSTYLTGVYTSKKITVTSLKTVFQPYDATLTALAAQTETEGSIQYYTAAATPAVLAKGTAYQLLNMNSGATAPTWTSTIGATDTRLTKIWATDLEVTNAPTVNGAALTTILQPLNDDLTTLSSGGTANCLWGEKSDSSGIECKTSINIQLDDSAAQFKSATASKGTLKFDQTGISDTKLVTVKYTATDSYTYTPTLVGNVSHLLGTTWTNGKWCSYSTSTGLTCNEDAPAGTGDMTTDAIWDAKGDLAVGTGANTAAKLAVGTAYQVLHVATDTPGWTSTLGATDTRLTKIWATDMELTNLPTIGGAAITTLLQAKDTDLDIFAGITPSTDIQALLASADNATALTNLGGWGVSGSITDEQLVCAETTGGSNLLKSCGAKTTINAGNSTLLCKDSSGEVEACGGVTISGTTSPVVNVNPQEVDGHTTSTDLTAAQVSNTIIHNYDQAASDVFLILPTAAAGYSFLLTVTTARSNHFGVEAGANDKIYLIASDGTLAAGDDGAAVVFTEAQVGQQAACWTFKTGASSYDWACKAIAIGTSTFVSHASSE